MSSYAEIFTRETLDTLFPADRSDQFFEALFGDASEGAYDIILEFAGSTNPNAISLELHLKQRPGRCLVCNLTHGLPEVFSRHPVINIAGLAADVAKILNHPTDKTEWKVGATKSVSSALHIIPLTITLQ